MNKTCSFNRSCSRCSSTSTRGARTWDASPSSSEPMLCLRPQVKRHHTTLSCCVSRPLRRAAAAVHPRKQPTPFLFNVYSSICSFGIAAKCFARRDKMKGLRRLMQLRDNDPHAVNRQTLTFSLDRRYVELEVTRDYGVPAPRAA